MSLDLEARMAAQTVVGAARFDEARRVGVDGWLRRRGVPPVLALCAWAAAVSAVLSLLRMVFTHLDTTSIGPAIMTVTIVLYAGRRRSLRWDRREHVRELVWTADVLGVAIPSYGYWRHSENQWQRGRRLIACGYVLLVIVLVAILLIGTCGLGALLLLCVSGRSTAVTKLRRDVDAAMITDKPGIGSAEVLFRDLDHITTQRQLAERALEQARTEMQRAETDLTRMRESVDRAEERMRRVRTLQELSPADQLVVAEVRDTTRDILTNLSINDRRAAGESDVQNRKSLWLWWLALILSIPANVLATLLTVRFGIG